MSERFTQKRITLENEKTVGKLKVSTLFSLLDNHPNRNDMAKLFNIDDINEEVICIDHIDTLFYRIKSLNEKFERYSITAYNKDISIKEALKPVEDLYDKKPLVFTFEEYIDIDEVKTDLSCYAIYNSKSTFLDKFELTKYANRLYKEGLGELAEYNFNYFKRIAEKGKSYNKPQSYRLVKNNGDVFLRGITSTDKYFEYGVDFTFVLAMLLLHQDMKQNAGNNYVISNAAISESKLELIVADRSLKDGGNFGKVSSAMIISTNDLGDSSLSFTKIIKVGNHNQGWYLFPQSDKRQNTNKTKLAITHSTKIENVVLYLNKVAEMLNNTEDFIKELKDAKNINTPDELRAKIYFKLTNPRGSFKDIVVLQDIFKPKIDNNISNFAKLLEMCKNAENLDIDYDLKDKLRYIISDIILTGKNAA